MECQNCKKEVTAVDGWETPFCSLQCIVIYNRCKASHERICLACHTGFKKWQKDAMICKACKDCVNLPQRCERCNVFFKAKRLGGGLSSTRKYCSQVCARANKPPKAEYAPEPKNDFTPLPLPPIAITGYTPKATALLQMFWDAYPKPLTPTQYNNAEYGITATRLIHDGLVIPVGYKLKLSPKAIQILRGNHAK